METAALQIGLRKSLQRRPPFAEWPLGKLLLFGRREQIEGEIERRRFLRELLHAAYSWMNPLQQRVEGKALAERHDDLAVERETIGFQLQRGSDDLREIPREVLAGF